MALWQVDIEKQLNAEFWTNVYHVDAADIASAETIAASIVAIERAVHGTFVAFTKMRVRNVADPFAADTTILSLLGQRAVATNAMPLFVVARVDFTAEIGRPSRKYLRGVLAEADVNSDNLESAAITFVNENYATPLAALVGYVDIDGQQIVNGGCHPRTGMRQLRRGSKRRTQPILP